MIRKTLGEYLIEMLEAFRVYGQRQLDNCTVCNGSGIESFGDGPGLDTRCGMCEPWNNILNSQIWRLTGLFAERDYNTKHIYIILTKMSLKESYSLWHYKQCRVKFTDHKRKIVTNEFDYMASHEICFDFGLMVQSVCSFMKQLEGGK